MDHRERPACSLAMGFGDQRTARRRWPAPRSRRRAMPSGGRRRVRATAGEEAMGTRELSRSVAVAEYPIMADETPLRALVGGACEEAATCTADAPAVRSVIQDRAPP